MDYGAWEELGGKPGITCRRHSLSYREQLQDTRTESGKACERRKFKLKAAKSSDGVAESWRCRRC